MTLETSLTLLLAVVIMVALLAAGGILFGAFRLLSSVRSPDGRPGPSIRRKVKRARHRVRGNSLPRTVGIAAGRTKVALGPIPEQVARAAAATGRGLTRSFGGVAVQRDRMTRVIGHGIVHATGKAARKTKRVVEVLREPDEPRPKLEPSPERRIRDLQATRR